MRSRLSGVPILTLYWIVISWIIRLSSFTYRHIPWGTLQFQCLYVLDHLILYMSCRTRKYAHTDDRDLFAWHCSFWLYKSYHGADVDDTLSTDPSCLWHPKLPSNRSQIHSYLLPRLFKKVWSVPPHPNDSCSPALPIIDRLNIVRNFSMVPFAKSPGFNTYS